MGSYLIAKLTGRNVCHISNAAPLGLADIRTQAWREDLIKLTGLSALTFPLLQGDMAPCGEAMIKGQKMLVYPDIGDVQATVRGTDVQPGDVIVNMATAGQVIMVKSDMDIGSADPSYYEVRPYFNGEYCHVISRMPSGRNLDVLIDFFRDAGERLFDRSLSRDEIWRRLMETAQVEDNQGLTVDVSFYELPEKLVDGSIQHIDRSNLTVDHVLGGALANIGQVYGHYIRLLAGNEAKRLVFCGGAAWGNPLLQRALAPAYRPSRSQIAFGRRGLSRHAANRSIGASIKDDGGKGMNPLISDVLAGNKRLGCFLSEIAAPNLLELLQVGGMDWVIVDCERLLRLFSGCRAVRCGQRNRSARDRPGRLRQPRTDSKSAGRGGRRYFNAHDRHGGHGSSSGGIRQIRSRRQTRHIHDAPSQQLPSRKADGLYGDGRSADITGSN